MNSKIEINSLSINKLKNDMNFVKYDIDASVDEIKNTDKEITLGYKFVLMSNPTNIKINIEGRASIYGEQSDISKHLNATEKNIPTVVNTIYQEIFPLFYIISKSMQIPCPAYKLHQISAPQKPEISTSTESVKVEKSPEHIVESNPDLEVITEKEIQIEQPHKPVIETQL